MILAKSQLLEYTQKASLPAPVYQSIKEGPSHEPIFKASVIVNGITYECPSAFRNRKPAEHAAALLALESLLKDAKESKDTDSVYASGLCKNLLQEYSQKLNLPVPSYKCVKTGEGNEAKFVCTVEIAGQSYVGGPARSKKDAAVKAARTALYVMGQQHNVPLGSSAVAVDPKSGSVDATNNKRPHNDADGGKKFKKRKANLKPRNWKKCKDNNNNKEIGAKEPEAEQTTNDDDANKETLSQDEKHKQEGTDMLKSKMNGENSSPHKNDEDKETK